MDSLSYRLSYWLHKITSGAIQYGVPTDVFLLDIVSRTWQETPKSINFTSPKKYFDFEISTCQIIQNE